MNNNTVLTWVSGFFFGVAVSFLLVACTAAIVALQS